MSIELKLKEGEVMDLARFGLRSPDKPEAEAVAWMKIIKTYDHNHGVEDVEAEFDFTPDCPGEGWRPLFASPVTNGGKK